MPHHFDPDKPFPADSDSVADGASGEEESVPDTPTVVDLCEDEIDPERLSWKKQSRTHETDHEQSNAAFAFASGRRADNTSGNKRKTPNVAKASTAVPSPPAAASDSRHQAALEGSVASLREVHCRRPVPHCRIHRFE